MNTLKAFECRDRAADTNAEFQKQMVLPYREMRPDSEPGNDADEMCEATWLTGPDLVGSGPCDPDFGSRLCHEPTLLTCSQPLKIFITRP